MNSKAESAHRAPAAGGGSHPIAESGWSCKA